MNELERVLLNRQVRLEVTISEPVPVPQPDRRYRVLVSLQRTDRPRYWNFLCHNCGSKLVELQNLEVYTLDDFYDPQNINNAGIGRHCKGTLPTGQACQYTYFFNVR